MMTLLLFMKTFSERRSVLMVLPFSHPVSFVETASSSPFQGSVFRAFLFLFYLCSYTWWAYAASRPSILPTIYLFERLQEREGERENLGVALATGSNSCHSCHWLRARVGAGSPVPISYVAGRAQPLEPSSVASQRCALAGSWTHEWSWELNQVPWCGMRASELQGHTLALNMAPSFCWLIHLCVHPRLLCWPPGPGSLIGYSHLDIWQDILNITHSKQNS